MPSKAVFCYEFNMANRPYPVLYPEGIPRGLHADQVKREMITPIHHLFQSFDELVTAIPHPKLLHNAEKEAKMARPVQGYLTSTGEFYDTEAEADLYEARYELDKASTEAVENMADEIQRGQITDVPTYLIGALPRFIEENEDIVFELIRARRAIREQESCSGSKDAEPEPAGTEVDRQATETSPPADLRVRPENNLQVDETANAKDKPASTRGKASGSKAEPPDLTDM